MVHRVFTTFLITIPLRALATYNTDQDAMLFILEKLCSLELLRVFMKNTKLFRAERAGGAAGAGEAERIYFFFLLRAFENRQFQDFSMD